MKIQTNYTMAMKKNIQLLCNLFVFYILKKKTHSLPEDMFQENPRVFIDAENKRRNDGNFSFIMLFCRIYM